MQVRKLDIGITLCKGVTDDYAALSKRIFAEYFGERRYMFNVPFFTLNCQSFALCSYAKNTSKKHATANSFLIEVIPT